MVMGGIVPIVNIDGVKPGDLVLDGKTLAGIFMGTITSWDDPAIKALNPSLTLPPPPIVVAHRSDGSGTTFNFTNYLGKESHDWTDKVGSDTAVEWPVGVGAKGSEGVANTVKQTAGCDRLRRIRLRQAEQPELRQDGQRRRQDRRAVARHASPPPPSNADFASAKNFNLIITNQPGDNSWPIAASTWVLIHAAAR